MKKLMYLAVFALALGFSSCGSDDGGLDCISLSVNSGNAAAEFGNNPSTASCNAYKAALEDFLNNNCSPDAEAEASFRSQLEALGDCSVL